jgi:uncharacterized protein YbjT (DUF2867 family)
MEGYSIVMIGATGAVGGEVVRTLVAMPDVQRLTLLGRRPVAGMSGPAIVQETVDVFDPASYAQHLAGHGVAICTFGVGQPSAVAKEELVRVDKTAVLDFAAVCRKAGVRHFALLSSIGAGAKSPSFYLRTKGELEDGLRALNFPRLSLFQPSNILTPTNRYGLFQGVLLAVWPWLDPLLAGPLRPYRGIPVGTLGRAIALNIRGNKTGAEVLRWDDFMSLSGAAR